MSSPLPATSVILRPPSESCRRPCREFGRIDTLVNNAGIFIAKPFTDYTDEDFASKIATNLAGFFHITQRAAAEMLKQGSGHIVNITTSLTDQRDRRRADGACQPDQGRHQFGDQGARHRIRDEGHPGERRLAGHHQDADARSGESRISRRAASGQADGRRSATSWTRFSISNPPAFVTGEILHVDGGQSAGH